MGENAAIFGIETRENVLPQVLTRTLTDNKRLLNTHAVKHNSEISPRLLLLISLSMLANSIVPKLLSVADVHRREARSRMMCRSLCFQV